MLLSFFLDVKKGISEDGKTSEYTFQSAFPNIIHDFQEYLCDDIKKAFEVDEDDEGEKIYEFDIK